MEMPPLTTNCGNVRQRLLERVDLIAAELVSAEPELLEIRKSRQRRDVGYLVIAQVERLKSFETGKSGEIGYLVVAQVEVLNGAEARNGGNIAQVKPLRLDGLAVGEEALAAELDAALELGVAYRAAGELILQRRHRRLAEVCVILYAQALESLERIEAAKIRILETDVIQPQRFHRNELRNGGDAGKRVAAEVDL